MSTFDTKLNSSICVLPWVHQYKSIDGKVAPCCHGNTLNSDESIELLRQQMLSDSKPSACSGCYKNERESGYSPRLQETIDWVKKFGEPNMKKIQLQSVDIRYDPTCNLKCKTCGPVHSTLWQKEKNIKTTLNIHNQNYLNSIDKKKLKKVYLAGGEPTFIKNYLLFLKKLYDENPSCEVVINTNLKKLSQDWKNIFTKFKNLTVVCSCDAIDTLGTYVRYPLIWKEFEENVNFVSKNSNFLQFNLVASNLTAHKLYETCNWMKTYSKNINISILKKPEHFSEQAVPIQQRNFYIKNIEKLKTFPVGVYYAMNFRAKIEYLLKKYEESEYNPILHQKLKKEIGLQDMNRKSQLKTVDNFLYSWILSKN